jgi:hypothetical protein
MLGLAHCARATRLACVVVLERVAFLECVAVLECVTVLVCVTVLARATAVDACAQTNSAHTATSSVKDVETGARR